MTHSETAKEQCLVKISLTKPSLLSSYRVEGTGASGDVRGSEWVKAGGHWSGGDQGTGRPEGGRTTELAVRRAGSVREKHHRHPPSRPARTQVPAPSKAGKVGTRGKGCDHICGDREGLPDNIASEDREVSPAKGVQGKWRQAGKVTCVELRKQSRARDLSPEHGSELFIHSTGRWGP